MPNIVLDPKRMLGFWLVDCREKREECAVISSKSGKGPSRDQMAPSAKFGKVEKPA